MFGEKPIEPSAIEKQYFLNEELNRPKRQDCPICRRPHVDLDDRELIDLHEWVVYRTREIYLHALYVRQNPTSCVGLRLRSKSSESRQPGDAEIIAEEFSHALGKWLYTVHTFVWHNESKLTKEEIMEFWDLTQSPGTLGSLK